MYNNKATFLIITLIYFLYACKGESDNSLIKEQDPTDIFRRLLEKGNEVYAERSGLKSFSKSLNYFDSALYMADTSSNLGWKKSAFISIGRVYDAWNNEPEKTIYFYSKGFELATKGFPLVEYIDAGFLTAHALYKAGYYDSSILLVRKLLYDCDTTSDLYIKNNYLPQLAFISTKVGIYELADSCIKSIPQGALIENGNYNAKDAFRISNTILHLYYYPDSNRHAWLDTLQTILSFSENKSDSAYYCKILSDIYGSEQQYDRAYQFELLENKLSHELTLDGAIQSLQTQILQTELKSVSREKELTKKSEKIKSKLLLAISILLLVSIFSCFYVFYSSKRLAIKNKQLATVNEQLTTEVARNVLLVKEMHHRIKNNLYLIYSLLNMQGQSSNNFETKNSLLSAGQRIESIATMHEQLFQYENNTIQMQAFIEQLLSTLQSTSYTHNEIETFIHLNSLTLSSRQCFPLALIFNEWITNSLKYATPKTGKLIISIQASLLGKEVMICYNDNGINNLDKPSKEGMGSIIIHLLITQLKGNLSTDKNFDYTLKFPLDE
jgi:two-component sensor histidine kinase